MNKRIKLRFEDLFRLNNIIKTFLKKFVINIYNI